MDVYMLALFCVVFLINTVIQVESKYCKYDSDGGSRYYMCPRNEYCCNIGCCISPTFQFYQLWYYWLMVIFMFVVCSGGQWWYRYWAHGGRYLTEFRMPHHHHHHHHHQAPVRPNDGLQTQTVPTHNNVTRTASMPTRVTYHPQREAVFLDTLWKPTYTDRGAIPTNGPPPAYTASTTSSTPTGVMTSAVGTPNVIAPQPSSPKPSPYMQIYGPPPSYESVVGLSTMATEVAQVAQRSQQHSQASNNHSLPQLSPQSGTQSPLPVQIPPENPTPPRTDQG